MTLTEVRTMFARLFRWRIYIDLYLDVFGDYQTFTYAI